MSTGIYGIAKKKSFIGSAPERSQVIHVKTVRQTIIVETFPVVLCLTRKSIIEKILLTFDAILGFHHTTAYFDILFAKIMA